MPLHCILFLTCIKIGFFILFSQLNKWSMRQIKDFLDRWRTKASFSLLRCIWRLMRKWLPTWWSSIDPNYLILIYFSKYHNPSKSSWSTYLWRTVGQTSCCWCPWRRWGGSRPAAGSSSAPWTWSRWTGRWTRSPAGRRTRGTPPWSGSSWSFPDRNEFI